MQNKQQSSGGLWPPQQPAILTILISVRLGAAEAFTSATIYVAVKNFYFTIFLDAFEPSVYVMVRMQMPFAGALSLRPERS